MTINLSKNGNVKLTKEGLGTPEDLKVAHCGLGWDINQGSGAAYDLDFFMLQLGAGGMVNSDADLIFYNNKTNQNGSVYVGEDNLDGHGDGFDEEGFIKFASVPENVSAIIVAVSIFEYDKRGQTFGQVQNAFCDVLNAEDTNVDKAALIHYDLTSAMGQFTGIVAGRFDRDGPGWKFTAVGEGVMGGMPEILRKYGINV